MGWFHGHKWVEISRMYHPATGGKGKFLSPDTMAMISIGITIITERCSGCGDTRQNKLHGKLEPRKDVW